MHSRARASPAQINWTKWITLRFGFLNGWFGRGMFFIFVGTNIISNKTGGNQTLDGGDVISILAGAACVFVGVIELLFGFKCVSTDGDDSQAGTEAQPAAEGGKKKGGLRLGFGGKPKEEGGSGEPAFTVNVTPNQLAQGATFAANNAGAIQNAAAAAGGASSGGGGTANPFFGNAHLANQQ